MPVIILLSKQERFNSNKKGKNSKSAFFENQIDRVHNKLFKFRKVMALDIGGNKDVDL